MSYQHVCVSMVAVWYVLLHVPVFALAYCRGRKELECALNILHGEVAERRPDYREEAAPLKWPVLHNEWLWSGAVVDELCT